MATRRVWFTFICKRQYVTSVASEVKPTKDAGRVLCVDSTLERQRGGGGEWEADSVLNRTTQYGRTVIAIIFGWQHFTLQFSFVIETLLTSGGRAISLGLCQTSMFYYIWRTSFVGQSISAALQHFIKNTDTFVLNKIIAVLAVSVLHLFILPFLFHSEINCAALLVSAELIDGAEFEHTDTHPQCVLLLANVSLQLLYSKVMWLFGASNVNKHK